MRKIKPDWIGQFVRADNDRLRLLAVTLLLFVLMSCLGPDRFLTARNFASMAFQFPELGLFAMAIMLSLITAGIDLSVVAIANLSGIMAALVLTGLISVQPPGWLLTGGLVAAAGLAMLTAAGCGLLNGWLVGRVGITPILATLGTMQLFTGLALVITKGPAVAGYPEAFQRLGSGTFLGIPLPLLVFLAVAGFTAVLLNWTPFGLKLYLQGSNETAARYSGIAERSLLVKAYLLSGLYSGLAGLLMIARTNAAKSDYGSSYLLQAVLVAIVGGVSPSGGFGTVSGLVLALLSLQFISSGFSMLRFSHFTKEFAWGALLLVVMLLNSWCRRKWQRRAS